eukprot:scaffold33987_cov124-Isochrysis_galbana.AAC.4
MQRRKRRARAGVQDQDAQAHEGRAPTEGKGQATSAGREGHKRSPREGTVAPHVRRPAKISSRASRGRLYPVSVFRGSDIYARSP